MLAAFLLSFALKGQSEIELQGVWVSCGNVTVGHYCNTGLHLEDDNGITHLSTVRPAQLCLCVWYRPATNGVVFVAWSVDADGQFVQVWDYMPNKTYSVRVR